ncbi:MAG: DsbA family protein [Gemmatimonadales bacterium]
MRIKRYVVDATTVALCALAGLLGFLALRRHHPVSGGHPRSALAVVDQPRVAAEQFARIAATGQRDGPADAPVTVVEFADYYCGYCATFEARLVRLRARYPQHVAVVVKHFMPVLVRAEFDAHLAAECAGDQGRFVAFDRAMYADSQKGVDRDAWQQVGRAVGIPDERRFESCVRLRRYADRVSADTRDGTALGVTCTPTTYINGIPVVGVVSFEVLDSIVAHELDRGRRGPR